MHRSKLHPYSITSSAIESTPDGMRPSLGSLEVDHELELGRLQDRQVAGLGTLENAARINASLVHGVPSRPRACRGVCRKTDQQLPALALEVMRTVTLSFEVNNRRAHSRRACVIHIKDEPAVVREPDQRLAALGPANREGCLMTGPLWENSQLGPTHCCRSCRRKNLR
jgi:hypothetical protein